MDNSKLDKLVSSYNKKLTKEEEMEDSMLKDKEVSELVDAGYSYLDSKDAHINRVLAKGDNRERLKQLFKELVED